MGGKSNLQLSETKAWMNILRISNAPTILSNIMVGIALAIVIQRECFSGVLNSGQLHIMQPFWIITLALLLLYFSGMVLNDAFDAKHDERVRPDRPISQGVISVQNAWATGAIMLCVGAALPFLLNVNAGLSSVCLAIAIGLYTVAHRNAFGGVIFMGICRGLVYVTTYLACYPNIYNELILFFACAIVAYTMLITLIGRFENDRSMKCACLTWLTPIPALVILLLLKVHSPIAWFMFFCLVLWTCLAWLDFRKEKTNQFTGMHKLLAGFALLDCVLIASIDEYMIMMVSIICFVLTIAAHRKILGT